MHAHDEPALTGRLTSLDAIKEFLAAGKAVITLVSLRTAVRYTYKISQSKDNANMFFVALLSGPDNETDYNYLGFIRNGVYAHGVKSKISADAGSAIAFSWFYGRIAAGVLPDNVEVWHEGRCGRCCRKLTVPASIERGIGPECAGKLGA
jgi:hypothetical protein